MNKKRTASILTLAILSANLPHSFAQDSIVVKTVADVYVRNNEDGPLGYKKGLEVKGGAGMSNPDFAGGLDIGTQQRTAFLRFPTATIAKNKNKNIKKAVVRLRIFGVDVRTEPFLTSNGIKISKVTDNSWTERDLLWSTRPNINAKDDSVNVAYYTSALARLTNKFPNTMEEVESGSQYFYVDVTDFIKSLVVQNTLSANIDFALQGYTNANSPEYNSRARGANGSYYLSKEFKIDGEAIPTLAPSLVVYY